MKTKSVAKAAPLIYLESPSAVAQLLHDSQHSRQLLIPASTPSSRPHPAAVTMPRSCLMRSCNRQSTGATRLRRCSVRARSCLRPWVAVRAVGIWLASCAGS